MPASVAPGKPARCSEWQVSYVEGIANHNGPESCGARSRGRRRSVDRGTYRPGLEPRIYGPAAQAAELGMRRRGGLAEGNTGRSAIARCALIPRGQRPRACTENTLVGTGRSARRLRKRELQTASGSRRTHADDERKREVGQLQSTCEVAEQGRGPAAEEMEGRGLAKGNSPERNALRLRAGRARSARLSEYVRQQRTIGNSGSPRSCTTSMTWNRLRTAYWK